MKRFFIGILFSVLFLSGCSTLYKSSEPTGTVACDVSYYGYGHPNSKDLVSFSAYGSSYDGTFISLFKMYNKTDNRVYIEWENARCDGGKVIFGDDRRITMNNPKADEAVSAHSFSLSRDITSMSRVGSDFIIPIYRVSDLKKGQTISSSLRIPVRFSDGKVIEYSVLCKFYWKEKDSQ